jgi:DNA-binding SARP family transcriptional activator
VTNGAGYRLAISPSDTDAGRFSRLADLARQALAGGRLEGAVQASRDALDLWRGTAYAGCEDTAFGQAEARRLAELRLCVVETRMEAYLALGRESAVVPELERRVGDYPLRERLWELLMLTYYRSGEQAQALATYDRVRCCACSPWARWLGDLLVAPSECSQSRRGRPASSRLPTSALPGR